MAVIVSEKWKKGELFVTYLSLLKKTTHTLFLLPIAGGGLLTVFCSLFRERVITFLWLSYHHITYWKEWSMYKKKREEIGTKRIKVNSCLIFYCCCNMLIFPRIFFISSSISRVKADCLFTSAIVNCNSSTWRWRMARLQSIMDCCLFTTCSNVAYAKGKLRLTCLTILRLFINDCNGGCWGWK